MTALTRTIRRHELVIETLEREPVRCVETLRDYREELTALRRADALLRVEAGTQPTGVEMSETTQVVHKAVEGGGVVRVPDDARVLCVGAQNSRVTVWYTTSGRFDRSQRTLAIIGTGYATEVSHPYYVGTAFVDESVWHVFDSAERAK